MTNNIKIRVYYEDTDCGDVVYYANYLKYMERGRTELLRQRGISLEQFRKLGVQFAVAEANVKYLASARYNDLLDVETKISASTAVTITFDTIIRNQNGILLVEGRVRTVCISDVGKASRIPKEIVEKVKE